MKSYTSIHDPKDLLTYEFLTKSLGVKKYDETATYSKGALVYHEDATDTYLDSIFEANQDIATAESWTAAHWDTVDLETIIKRSMHLYEPYMEYDGTTAKEVIYMEKCVIFSGSSAFDLGLVDDKWYGTNLDKSKTGSLEISTDKKTWETWDYTAKGAVLQSNGKYEVYVRGKGNNNTCDNATPNPNYSTFTTTAPVNLIGKLDWIIDYTAASPVCGDCSNLFGKAGGSPAKIVDASGFTLSANLDPAAALADFFQDCTTLTTPPTLPAIQISEGCYYGFFIGCTSLKTAPELPATSVAKDCYRDMFVDCTSLTTAPELPAMDLSGCNECYDAMFRGCISLTTAPELPATSIAELCYNQMFQECEKLTTAPSTLPADNLTGCNSCYVRMFAGCLALETAPTLPATRLVDNCYQEMFDDCIALKTCPELACTNLADNCYEKMFQGCVALTAPCELPAETLFPGCYRWMFNNCTSITWTIDTSANAYIIPTSGSGTEPTGAPWNEDMFAGNAGDLPEGTGTPLINTTYYYGTAAPGEDPAGTLTFYNLEHRYPEKDIVITNTLNADFEYSVDSGLTWITLAVGSSTPAAEEVKIRGTLDTDNGTYSLMVEGTRVGIKGKLENGKNYANLFASCTVLVDASKLIGADTLLANCYQYMFSGCTSLTTPPILPATTLQSGCYQGMFAYCTTLITPPALPATDLVAQCYKSMFKECTSLTTVPNELENISVWATSCCESMFESCNSIVSSPDLGGGDLAERCFACMFMGSGISNIEQVWGDNFGTECCYQMFAQCTNLETAPSVDMYTSAGKSCCYQMFFESGVKKYESNTIGYATTNLGEECFCQMFSYTSLEVAPDLPAGDPTDPTPGTLAKKCYSEMFSHCRSLTTPPIILPATTLAEYCYYRMFYESDALTAPCKLPATTMAENCYYEMFDHCTGITWTTDISATAYRIPTTGAGTPASGWNTNMFTNNSGTLPGSETTPPQSGKPVMGTTYYYGEDPAGTFTFYNLEHKYPKNDVVITNTLHSTSSIEYSIDGGSTWTVLTNGASTPAAGEVKIRGTLVTVDPSDPDVTYPLTITGTRVAVKGQLEDSKNYRSLFNGCTALVDASGLRGATTLVANCYRDMFSGCSSLIAPPTLPATQLADACYYGMFCGCAALTTAPELSATTLANSCYAGMFWQCTGLEAAPELPATTLAELCYSGMFIACTSLTTPPALPATTLADNCYSNMFSNCTSLIEPPEELPAEQLAEYCYSYMFSDCISLIYAPTILARTLADYCCENMFYGCTALLYPGSGLDLLAEEMKTECYQQMFARCTSLTETPCIYATTAADSCFERMFEGCISLTMVNGGLVMDLTTAAEECCKEMFKGCISLSSVDPGLLASVATLDASSFASMFEDCTLFNTTLELPAENLVISCYSRMFYNCKSLTIPPALPATTLAESCYQDMFNGCAHIRKCPELPVTTLADFCYMRMFANCVSLTEPCALPAITLISSCYKEMFSGCTGIEFASSGTAYRIPTTGTSTTLASDNVTNMFANCSGTLPGSEKTTPTPGTPQINTTYYIKKAGDMNKYEPYIEYDGSTAKEVVHMDKCVIFSGDSAFDVNSGLGNPWTGKDSSGNAGTIEYSTNKKDWTVWAGNTAISAIKQANGKFEIYFRGKGNFTTGGYAFSTTANCNIIGKLDWIIDYTVDNPACGVMGPLFGVYGGPTAAAAKIVDASGFVLPTNITVPAALQNTFHNCTTLTKPPQLPATTLTASCYMYMFMGCTSLTEAPELPATTLAANCYQYMFARSNAASPFTPGLPLKKCPELPATTLAANCYQYMFWGCQTITECPELPATTLANGCYQQMFEECIGLKTLPKLNAIELPASCYKLMFSNCIGIKWDTTGTPYAIPYGKDCVTTPGTEALNQMFINTNGKETTFPVATGTPSINTTYYYNPQPEEFVRKGKEYMEVISGTAPITGFTVDANGVLSFTRSSIEYVTHIDKSVIFTSPNTFNLQLSGNAWHGDGTLEYSTDGHTWETYGTTNATTLPAPKLQDNGKYELYLRGKGNTYTSDETDYTQFTTGTADRINIIGKFDYLLDYSSTPTVKSVKYLFYETNIVDASELILPMNFGETNDGNCLYLFSQCEYLTGVPQLPATTLATGCYADMFEGCTSLTVVPTLSATQLAIGCYAGMFQGCTALTAAPALPATTLAIACYSGMFLGCEALTTAPELPATTLANNCYQRMFLGCEALTAAPALPATTLADNCYQRMFENCTGITKIPALPATNIPSNAYNVMFGSCTGLKFYPVGSTTSESFTIPSTTTVGTNALANMFQYCTDFPETGGTPVPGTVYGYGDKLPDPYITIESTDNSTFCVQMMTSASIDLRNIEWSTDGSTWKAGYDPSSSGQSVIFPVSDEEAILTDKVYVRGNGFTHFTDDTGYTFFIFMNDPVTGAFVADPVIKISGELRYLYDKSGEATCGNAGALFSPLSMGGYEQAVISDVSELVFPTKLGTDAANGLFANMFYNGNGNISQPITTPPQLPATQLTESCYCYMFYGCSSLTTPPALPATTLADYCYNYMFYGCGFTSAPTLPALTVPSGAYVGMFSDCTSLTTPPELPATTIEIDNTLIYDNDGDGYEWMFYGCTSLTTIPTMPASITINRTGTYAEETSPRAFYQMIEAEEDEPYNPSLDFSKSDKSWICPTITDGSGAANLSNMFEGQANADDSHGFKDGYGTPIAGTTYNYGNV